jgi:hypothetical protein
MSDLDGRLTFLAGCHPTLNEHAKALIREAAARIRELEQRLNDFTDPKMPGMVSVGLLNTERETCNRIRSDNDSLRVRSKELEAELQEEKAAHGHLAKIVGFSRPDVVKAHEASIKAEHDAIEAAAIERCLKICSDAGEEEPEPTFPQVADRIRALKPPEKE